MWPHFLKKLLTPTALVPSDVYLYSSPGLVGV